MQQMEYCFIQMAIKLGISSEQWEVVLNNPLGCWLNLFVCNIGCLAL